MISRVLMYLLIFLFFHLVHAQKNFLPGEVVTLEGEVIPGLIDYRNWATNPDRVVFRQQDNNDITTYAPLDIRSFTVKDERYRSAVIEKEISPDKIGDLEYENELRIVSDTVFLQTVILGSKSLFHLSDKNGRNYFYIEDGGSISLLVYKRYRFSRDNEDIIKTNNQYLGQLSYYLQDCPAIRPRLNGVEYQKSDLERFFEHYYECIGETTTFQKKTENIVTKLGVLAGLSSTNLQFESDARNYLSEADFGNSTDIAIGITLGIIIPRTQKKWVIHNELLYTAYQVQGEFESPEARSLSEFTMQYLKLNNLVRFQYPLGRSRLFLNAGIANGFAMKKSGTRRSESLNGNPTNDFEDQAIPEIRTHEQSYLLGVGIKWKNWSVEGRFENGNGVSPFNGLKSIARRYFIFIGYEF